MDNLKFQNIEHGDLEYCQISKKKDITEVIDLGDQPLCDSLLTLEDIKNKNEKFYPLKLMRSKSLGHGQLSYIPKDSEIYHPEYPYRPGITREVVDHHSEQAQKIINKNKILKNSLIVDIGSNDGTLLREYKRRGMKAIGVEPTNMAQLANQDNLETLQMPFNQNAASIVKKKYGKAKLITATNVFAHMSTLNDVINGIIDLLDDDGLFVFENHYIIDILKLNQYDSIYHEHIRSYSLTSLEYLFSLYNLKIIDAEVVERYNGTIQVTVSKNNKNKQNKSVYQILNYEKEYGLFEDGVWSEFKRNVLKTKNDLRKVLKDLKLNGKSLVANSCPGRCSTLLNFCDIGTDLIPYIAEQPTSHKLNKYLPGKHIPILDNKILFQEQPDYVLILAWHYAEPIIKSLKLKGLKSKFIIPLPEVKIID